MQCDFVRHSLRTFLCLSTALVNAIVIRVVGINNTPIVGVPVAFQITAGAGVITPQSALTNAFGEVSAKWTLGPIPGANTLFATVANNLGHRNSIGNRE